MRSLTDDVQTRSLTRLEVLARSEILTRLSTEEHMASWGAVLSLGMCASLVFGCTDDRRRGGGDNRADSGLLVVADAAHRDAGAVVDAFVRDAGLSPLDAGPRDAGRRDAGSSARDAGPRDAGSRDAGSRDAGGRDAGRGDAGARDAGPPDAGPSVPGDCSGGVTKYFVASVLAPAIFGPEGLPGFNLDGRVSLLGDTLSCGHEDGSNLVETGVDNVYGETIGLELASEFADTLRADIERGDLLLLVRLDHVDSLLNDDCVQVSILMGVMPVGMAPRLGRTGLLLIDQTFDLDAASLEADRATPRARVVDASIDGGHVRVGPIDVVFSLARPIVVTLTDSVVSFDVSDGGLSNLLIGGGVQVTELARGFDAREEIDPENVRLLRVYTDLDYDSATRLCDAMSMVFAGEAVRAWSSGLVVSR